MQIVGGPPSHTPALGAAEYVERNLQRGHVTGPYRALTQDISFGFDWLGDCLCRISTASHPTQSWLG